MGGMSSFFANTDQPRRPAWLQGKSVVDLPDRLPQAKRGKRLRITTIGEAVLTTPCADVTNFGSPELKTLIDDMFATMEIAQGVGLAAPQVDAGVRIFVFDCPDEDDVRHVGHICNPVIDPVVAEASDTEPGNEGCLSIPGPSADVVRPVAARVSGQDMHGQDISFEATGFLARCFQHETDHVNGILFTDHLDDEERARVLSEMEDMKEDVWAEWDVRAEKLGK